MAFQIPKQAPFEVNTIGLGQLLFKPFLAGTLSAFAKALKGGEATPAEFVTNFTADQARVPSPSETDLSLKYEKGLQVDLKRLASEDIANIASAYLRKNEVEMTWYASGDGVEKTDSGGWLPANSVTRASAESDVEYFMRLAQECVNESSRTWDRISKSFRSILDLGKLSSFVQADLNTTLSTNRIKAIVSTPPLPLRQSVSVQNLATPRPSQPNDSVNDQLSELVGEVQKVGALIAEQCEIQRNQNTKTDLLIEASNQATGQADQNLKWAKYGIFLTSLLSVVSLGYSIHLANQQSLTDNARDKYSANLQTRILASQKTLVEIAKLVQSISDEIKPWRDRTVRRD